MLDDGRNIIIGRLTLGLLLVIGNDGSSTLSRDKLLCTVIGLELFNENPVSVLIPIDDKLSRTFVIDDEVAHFLLLPNVSG